MYIWTTLDTGTLLGTGRPTGHSFCLVCHSSFLGIILGLVRSQILHFMFRVHRVGHTWFVPFTWCGRPSDWQPLSNPLVGNPLQEWGVSVAYPSSMWTVCLSLVVRPSRITIEIAYATEWFLADYYAVECCNLNLTMDGRMCNVYIAVTNSIVYVLVLHYNVILMLWLLSMWTEVGQCFTI